MGETAATAGALIQSTAVGMKFQGNGRKSVVVVVTVGITEIVIILVQ